MRNDMERLTKLANDGDEGARFFLLRENIKRGIVTVPDKAPTTITRRCCRCSKQLINSHWQNIGMGKRCYHNSRVAAEVADAPNREAAQAALNRFLDVWQLAGTPAEANLVMMEVGEMLHDPLKLTGGKCDKAARRVKWALSFGSEGAARTAMLDIISALGYNTLRNMIENNCVIGHTEVGFAHGLLLLNGPRAKKSTRREMLRQVPSRRWNRSLRCWTFSPRHYAQLGAFVTQYYLNLDGLADALAQAKLYYDNLDVPAPVETPAPSVDDGPKVEDFILRQEGQCIMLSTPWHQQFIASLKADIPYRVKRAGRRSYTKCREWNTTQKAWIVRGERNVQRALELIRIHFVDAA